LQIELPVCHQGHLFGLVMTSSSPHPPKKLGIGWELLDTFLC
jgi:hypothetical protein